MTIAGFQAESQDGPIRGIAAFIEYGGDAYRILGYAAAPRYSSYEGAFRRAIGSFDRLTDRSALAVEPRRIDLVRVDGRIALDTFATRYGASADVQTLSLINGVSTSETLDPGTWKRVVGETPRVGGRAPGRPPSIFGSPHPAVADGEVRRPPCPCPFTRRSRPCPMRRDRDRSVGPNAPRERGRWSRRRARDATSRDRR